MLPSLSIVIATHGLRARKTLGQNFLLDEQLLDHIAAIPQLAKGDLVYEVGPGPGGLTRALLRRGARVVAVERDLRCLPILSELAEYYSKQIPNTMPQEMKNVPFSHGLEDQDFSTLPPSTPSNSPSFLNHGESNISNVSKYKKEAHKDIESSRLRVISGDALRLDPIAACGGETGFAICANLPYNIGTALLTRWLEVDLWPPYWRSLTLMFQQEVAERIIAPSNVTAYGRLSVLSQWRTRAHIARSIDRSAFTPSPRVASAVVHIEPIPAPPGVDGALLSRLTAHGFGQRRKMLRSSLRGIVGAMAALEHVDIDSRRRAETLSISEWVDLARYLGAGRRG